MAPSRGDPMTPAERIKALETEIERLKQRADTFQRILSGSEDEWLGIQSRLGSDVATVTIDAPLVEARQTALALATLVKTLSSLSDEAAGTAPAVDPLARIKDELAERRAQGA